MNTSRAIAERKTSPSAEIEQANLTIEFPKLSPPEEKLLNSHEEVIGRGLQTFFEVGCALLAIREGRLYRNRHSSFAAYCHERWGFGRAYAWRVIGAAERLKLLPEDGELTRPKSEFQMRPFLKLAPEEFPMVWKQVLERAKNGKITSQLIGGLVNETARRSCNSQQKESRKICLAKGTVGEIIVLLDRIKRQIDQNLSEPAKANLERIEQLLFPPSIE